MINILGEPTYEKRQFVFSLGSLLYYYQGNCQLMTDNFSDGTEDYMDNFCCFNFNAQSEMTFDLSETDNCCLEDGQNVYYLCPKKKEIDRLLAFGNQVDKLSYIIVGNYVDRGQLTAKYLKQCLAEVVDEVPAIMTIDLDSIDYMLCYEGEYRGYYPIADLSFGYRQVLEKMAVDIFGFNAKKVKRSYRREGRLVK